MRLFYLAILFSLLSACGNSGSYHPGYVISQSQEPTADVEAATESESE